MQQYYRQEKLHWDEGTKANIAEEILNNVQISVGIDSCTSWCQ